jgi:catechol 2,3-dioxygenase-like lactoylglutathione lyase family enzyme
MMRFDNVRLLTSRFGEMFVFYRDVLGLAVSWGDLQGIYASFQTNGGSTALALFARSEMSKAIGTSNLPAESVSQDKAVVVFEVEDVDMFARQLISRGVILIDEPKDMSDWGIRVFHLRDPDGNLLEIFSELKKTRWSQGPQEADQRQRSLRPD